MYRINPKTCEIPIFFHNLKGFDSHLLLRYYKPRHGDIKVIAQNSEKFICLKIGDLMFKYSYTFMLESLADLVATLPPNKFVNLRAWLENDVANNNFDRCGDEQLAATSLDQPISASQTQLNVRCLILQRND